MSNNETVIELLLSFGYIQDGVVAGGAYRVGSQVSGYTRMEIPDRMKLRLPDTNQRVSIGKRTTCFYQVVDKQATNFVNFNTKDIDVIKAHAEEIINTKDKIS